MNLNDIGDVYEDVFINNRQVSLQNTMNYMHAKVTEIFHYDGLPLTLPKRILESVVTKNGAAVVYEYDGNLFVTDTLPSSKPTIYQEAVEVRINHRVGTVNEQLIRTIGVDAVLVRNDSHCIGLDPIITEFAIMTAQAKITMMRNLVDLRGNYIIQAKDENAYRSALEYEKAVRRGDTAVIMAEEFDTMEGLVVHSTPIANNPATQTIELFQYIQSYYYSELGIELNNNMKREYVSDSEIEKSSGMPLIHNMLNLRQEAVRDIKALFGVDITVSLSSEWKEDQETPVESEMGQEEPDADGAEVEVPADEQSTDPSEPTEETPEDPTAEGETDEAGNPESESDEDVADDGSPLVEPEVEPVTAAELEAATEALTGEEVKHEAEDDSTADESDTESDVSEDEAERDELETEEGDDEGR